LLAGLQASNYGSRHIISVKNGVSSNILSRPELRGQSPRGSKHDRKVSGHSGQGHKVRGVWDFGFSDSGGALCLVLDVVSRISDGLRGLADGGDILVDI